MIGQVPKASVDTFCVGYVTSYGSVWFLQNRQRAAYTFHQKSDKQCKLLCGTPVKPFNDDSYKVW